MHLYLRRILKDLGRELDTPPRRSSSSETSMLDVAMSAKGIVGEDVNDVGSWLDFGFQSLQRVWRVDLRPVRSREEDLQPFTGRCFALKAVD